LFGARVRVLGVRYEYAGGAIAFERGQYGGAIAIAIGLVGFP
jgi:hypothetical protein